MAEPQIQKAMTALRRRTPADKAMCDVVKDLRVKDNFEEVLSSP